MAIKILDLLSEADQLPPKAKLKLKAKPKNLREWVENKDFDKLWKKYVPDQGEAKTMFGEAIRALGRLEYDYYNNGFGNAFNSHEIESHNYYGDDDEPETEYTYEPNEYYADMGRHLVKFLTNKKADPEILSAAKVIAPSKLSLEPWDRSPDPKFKSAVETLKNWFVENEKAHA